MLIAIIITFTQQSTRIGDMNKREKYPSGSMVPKKTFVD